MEREKIDLSYQKTYYCIICEKNHRVSSKKGQQHLFDNSVDFSNNGHH